jgi:hypothetical protein
MNIDEDRVEEIFHELFDQLEKITIGPLKDSASRILEDKAYYHESEERRAKKQLSIFFDKEKQEEIYREINLKKNRATAKAEAYKRAKQGI